MKFLNFISKYYLDNSRYYTGKLEIGQEWISPEIKKRPFSLKTGRFYFFIVIFI